MPFLRRPYAEFPKSTHRTQKLLIPRVLNSHVAIFLYPIISRHALSSAKSNELMRSVLRHTDNVCVPLSPRNRLVSVFAAGNLKPANAKKPTMRALKQPCGSLKGHLRICKLIQGFVNFSPSRQEQRFVALCVKPCHEKPWQLKTVFIAKQSLDISKRSP